MHAVKKASRGPKRAGAGIQGGEKSSYGAPGLITFPMTWNFICMATGRTECPQAGTACWRPNKGVTSKGHTIGYRKNKRKF